MAIACSEAPEEPEATPLPNTLFEDQTQNLPSSSLAGLSMDAAVGDLDADGDLDVLVANEFGPNILLLNDGTGRFTDESQRLPGDVHDSEDVGIADFDGDGDLDVVVVSEDDRTNELYLNDGTARFTKAGDRIPVQGVSNAVVVADITGDGHVDILIGNNGQNVILVNTGGAQFVDETPLRLPSMNDVTQDIELGDIDGDGDQDLLVGNEDRNRLLVNDGSGMFSDESDARIPLRPGEEETREADFGDVDGDGDLDILFANVAAFVPGADRNNRLLINSGKGFFTDETANRLPADDTRSFEADFIDLDGDGDADIVTGNLPAAGGAVPVPYRAYLNGGSGIYTDATTGVFPLSATGFGFDIEAHDFDGDGDLDLYLASRGSGDRLLIKP